MAVDCQSCYFRIYNHKHAAADIVVFPQVALIAFFVNKLDQKDFHYLGLLDSLFCSQLMLAQIHNS